MLSVKEMRAVAGCKERLGARQNAANLQWAGDSIVHPQEYSSALVLPPSLSSSSSSFFSLVVDLQGILCLLAKDTL